MKVLLEPKEMLCTVCCLFFEGKSIILAFIDQLSFPLVRTQQKKTGVEYATTVVRCAIYPRSRGGEKGRMIKGNRNNF